MGKLIRVPAAIAAAAAVFAVAVTLGASRAWAQQKAGNLKQQIVGAWRLVSIYNEEGGKKTHNFSEKPIGLVIYDGSGNIMQYLSKPEVPRFAVANRLKGTDAEYRAVMQSVLAGFGTYTIEGDAIIIKWIASSYPNRAGTTEKRPLKIAGDELTTVNPTAASGGIAYTKFARVK